MKSPTPLRLKVEKIQQSCLFELSWGKGQQTKAILDYPDILTHSYQAWQQAYRYFYQTAVRGRVEEQGSLPTLDPHARLVKAETKFLNEFRRWLRHEKLHDIRQGIAEAAKELSVNGNGDPLNLFLTCSPIELERLPWEAWELEKEMGTSVTLRSARMPDKIHSQTAKRNRYRHGGARILAILGDNTGLDFQGDLQALKSLSALAEIKVISWQVGQEIAQWKRQICETIAEQKGWDILFFAGHSNETDITGGEIAIAPKTAISISEIAPHLQKAQARGLQFALFNSCSGLSIANSLIDLGLSQVAVMREPIHNQVAQIFLIQFLKVLATYRDVHDALREACQFLKEEKNLEYPSAYLIPSLFCHPEAQLFRIEPFGVKAKVKRWLPTQKQAIALSVTILLSLMPPVQQFLLEQRTFIEAIYRNKTGQLPPPNPPILLLEIDEISLFKAKINHPKPINRPYLAQLIEKLSQVNAKVIGLDYLLDFPQGKDDQILAQSIKKAVEKKGIWFVWGAIEEDDKEKGIIPEIANLHWSLQGSIESYPNYVRLPSDCYLICPFSYLLALVYTLNQNKSALIVPQPKLDQQKDLRREILQTLEQHSPNNATLTFFQQAKINPITSFSQYLRQQWLRPINDFSLPLDSIYQSLPAGKLLQTSPEMLKKEYQFNQQVILIASGGYQEAGIAQEKDRVPIPLAVTFWRHQLNLDPDKTMMTRGEAHAYSLHHWLRGHWVVPLPDLWMVLLAACLGKGVVLSLAQRSHQSGKWLLGLAGITAMSGVASLQIYITAGVLLPWLLPSAAFWIYLLPDGKD